MAFNIALSGLNASSRDLDTTGNNISNASTVGYKKSRVEFGDLFSSGLLNFASQQTGSGVQVQDIRQQFQQGNITGTDNGLDMAIDGEGFFVLDDGGERRYSRAGEFGVNQEGFITNNQGMRLQGYGADSDGEIGDVVGDLNVDTENLAPRRTTSIDANLNLDSREEVLASRFSSFTADGALMGSVADFGEDLPGETFTITTPGGSEFTLDTESGPAGDIAAQLSEQDGLRVDAQTTARLDPGAFNPEDGDQLTINNATYDLSGVTGEDGLSELASQINDAPPSGITAQIGSDGQLRLESDQGDNIDFSFSTTNGSIGIAGDDEGATARTLDENDDSATVRGVLDFRVDDGFEIDADGDDFIDAPSVSEQVNNAFDPNDSRTFNHSTSTEIFDSLGNSHELSKFFVREPSGGPNPSNLWSMYVQIDGENVGPDDSDGNPTLAQYDLRFNSDGSLDETLSDDILVNNWTPRNSAGEPNGASGPDPDGELPIPDPPTSSNFAIDMSSTTQVGSDFAVNDLQQNGFATGRLSGLDVSDDGVVFARYTNGESNALGQVALANFRNPEGLAQASGTTWAESFQSGNAVVSRPNTGPLGSIAASSVEESNVDLSEQLVNLIIAQRNFQANAKTIETSDQVTQTIINLR